MYYFKTIEVIVLGLFLKRALNPDLAAPPAQHRFDDFFFSVDL